MTKPNDTTTDTDKAPEKEPAPVVLQSPKKGLTLCFDMGKTAYLEGGGRRTERAPAMLEFDRGVCSVHRERWEQLGFKTRDAFLKALRAFQRKGTEFVIREDLETLGAGRSAPSTPPLVIPK